ncbi:MAG: glycosyltransferase family 2 protein [Candidatus Omnitrophica bacterium]|nr:glycosyltransferase family 2 protein [Candidatus Omnitrophota bacterium]
MKLPVSVIAVTHNEESNIDACLASVSWAEEIIVVDGSSQDRTADIARKYTGKVFVKENADCETQRIFGLSKATQPWFFLIDADERVSPELARSIERAVTSESKESAFHILRANFLEGCAKPVHFNYPEYHLRLFRKSDLVSLPEKIHRVPEVRGSVGRLEGVLDHYFFGSVTQYLEKMNFYTNLEAQYCLSDSAFSLKGVRGFTRLFFRPLGRFMEYYFAKKAILDGYWGLVFAAGAGYYELLINLRILLARKK